MVPHELQLRCSLRGACAIAGVTSSSLCSRAMEEMLLGLGSGKGLSGCFWLLESRSDL